MKAVFQLIDHDEGNATDRNKVNNNNLPIKKEENTSNTVAAAIKLSTITFTCPPILYFFPSLGGDSKEVLNGKGVTVEIALNGTHYVSTGYTLKYDINGGKVKKVEKKKK